MCTIKAPIEMFKSFLENISASENSRKVNFKYNWVLIWILEITEALNNFDQSFRYKF